MYEMRFIRLIVIVSFGFVFLLHGCKKQQSLDFSSDQLKYSMNRAITSSKLMIESLANTTHQLPRSLDNEGELITSDPAWWTSGFFPGQLWYLYEYSGEEQMKTHAEIFSKYIESQKYSTDNHDIGFMLFCSFGNGFRLTKNVEYKEILITGANSLMKRYDANIGSILSWDYDKSIWQFPVIIDNMMNLELLFWAAKELNDSTMYNAAINHADKTMKHGFRPDASCWHVVSYDTITGLPHVKQTHQGLNDSSSWARGQAWALYGYTMVYRESGEKRFLEHAINIANYIINHPSMPEDLIPLWDFHAPVNDYRDASAAAIIASALIELADYAPEHNDLYSDFATKQLISLSSDKYLAMPNTNGNFLLRHSVGNYPSGYEIDKPLSYADYYYIEALIRYKKRQEHKNTIK